MSLVKHSFGDGALQSPARRRSSSQTTSLEAPVGRTGVANPTLQNAGSPSLRRWWAGDRPYSGSCLRDIPFHVAAHFFPSTIMRNRAHTERGRFLRILNALSFHADTFPHASRPLFTVRRPSLSWLCHYPSISGWRHTVNMFPDKEGHTRHMSE